MQWMAQRHPVVSSMEIRSVPSHKLGNDSSNSMRLVSDAERMVNLSSLVDEETPKMSKTPPLRKVPSVFRIFIEIKNPNHIEIPSTSALTIADVSTKRLQITGSERSLL
jgi:hypothetical protein